MGIPGLNKNIKDLKGINVQNNQCKVCKEVYEAKFVEDFENGICLPCQSQARHEEWEKKTDGELQVVNESLNAEYDFNSFCFDCWACPEKLLPALSLSKTPILLDVYDSELSNKQEYYNDHQQQRLF
jgi:hypothetical protein